MQDNTWSLLSKYNVAYTIVDEPLLPPEVHVTADFAYFRWHGKGEKPWYDYEYKSKELEEWLPRVREVEASTKTTFGYFNNHFQGYAVENALEILQMLDKLTSNQEQALLNAKKHLKMGKEEPTTLNEWSRGGDKRIQIVEILTILMGETRLARAFTIPDVEVRVKTLDNNSRIEGKVRNYNILLDKNSKVISHDCGDWERSIETHRLCKHIGKVFLILPEEASLNWLLSIESELDDWRFVKPTEQIAN
jgi:hypothetical protein